MSPYLEQRKKRYYFRVRVPGRFLHIFKTPQVRLSLRTNNKLRADKKALELEAEFGQLCDLLDKHLRNPFLSEREIEGHISKWIPSRIERTKPKKLSEVITEYKRNMSERWRPKTEQEASLSMNLMVGFFGDKPVADLSKSDAIKFLEHLQGLKIRGNGDRAIDVKTVNKHISRCSAVLELAKQREYCSKNPLEGVRVQESKHKRSDGERECFSTEELQKILDYVLVYPQPWPIWDKPSMFWVPLISLFSGMRLNEICQLYKEDFIQINGSGLICMRVDDNRPDKRLKNGSSRRNVPVHSMLIKFGLLKYVNDLGDGERLFPELRNYRDGYGHSFKRFMPLIRECVTENPAKVFHSFRHGVATMLSEAGYPTTWRADLLGHDRPGNIETDATYTKSTKESTVAKMLEKVEYPGVDFSKCYVYDKEEK